MIRRVHPRASKQALGEAQKLTGAAGLTPPEASFSIAAIWNARPYQPSLLRLPMGGTPLRLNWRACPISGLIVYSRY